MPLSLLICIINVIFTGIQVIGESCITGNSITDFLLYAACLSTQPQNPSSGMYLLRNSLYLKHFLVYTINVKLAGKLEDLKSLFCMHTTKAEDPKYGADLAREINSRKIGSEYMHKY